MSNPKTNKMVLHPLRHQISEIEYPVELPIIAKRQAIIDSIQNHPVTIVTGETGSGKTTQIPKICLEAGRGHSAWIGCTQPRRIAAVTVAKRVAEELGEDIGTTVGYKIRFEDRTPRNTIFKFMTDGILLMEAQRDRLLRAYDTIIVDEAHERSLNIDFIIGILRTLIPRRPEFRIVITSATIDTEKFSQAFTGAPVIEVSGRLYPVEVRYRPLDPIRQEKGDLTPVEAVVETVDTLIAAREPGDILIFMPTERDIRETCELLQGRFHEDVNILPLFSRLTTANQQRIFQITHRRRIVVSTNVAETSITIPGIRFVIDTGLARMLQYNPRSRTTGLPVRPISRSSADQRCGRCGRVRKGVCIRLYSEEDYLSRPQYTPPEILRSNLAGVILRMLALGLGAIDTFPFIDRPSVKSVRDGFAILQELDAIEPPPKKHRGTVKTWQLTATGRFMARLPLDPRISRMIMEARREGCLPEILIIAAALSIQDPRERPADKEDQADLAQAHFKDPASDFSALLNLWQRCHGSGAEITRQNHLRRFCRANFLSYRRMREWQDIRDQIARFVTEQEHLHCEPSLPFRTGADLYKALHRCILSGYLGHIAVRIEKNIYQATQGRRVMLFPGSGLYNRGGEWIVAAEMVETSRLYARTAATIDKTWLEELGGRLCHRTYAQPRWSGRRGEVVATERVTLFGLTIVEGRSVSFGRIDPEAASAIFIRDALVNGDVSRPIPFLNHNLALIEKIFGLEEKLRRRDILVGEEDIVRFYQERLPGIFDIRTLHRLIRDRGGDLFLRMQEDDLLVKAPDPEEVKLFPDSINVRGWRLDCRYRFEPGALFDGVTLRVPIESTPSVRAESMDWEIPGLLPTKIMALLRGLPKTYRKVLMPIEKTCAIILAEMVREGALPSTLSRFIVHRFGVDIPVQNWGIDTLDEHLKLRFSIVDADDREVTSGRTLEILRQAVVEQEPKRILQARAIWERNDLTDWDFCDLPEFVTLAEQDGHAPSVYPALAADAQGIAIRLFLNSEEARISHRGGVRALLTLQLRDHIRELRKAIAPGGGLKLWGAAFGGVKPLERAIIDKVLTDLFESDVRTETAFRRHAEQIRPRIVPYGLQVRECVTPPLKALYETTEQIRLLEWANRGNRLLLSFFNELREEAHHLLPVDFLLRYESERLPHLVRYLRALAVRAERGSVHLEKVVEKGRDLQRFVLWRNGMVRELPPHTPTEKRKALDDFFWLIEEYKVSLFAQELKTAVPVSAKRLEVRQAEIQKMA